MTTTNRQSLSSGSAVVGFQITKVGNDARIYVGTRYSCPPTNTSPIHIGPAANDCRGMIHPGQTLAMSADSSAMYCYADDLDQPISWVQH